MQEDIVDSIYNIIDQVLEIRSEEGPSKWDMLRLANADATAHARSPRGRLRYDPIGLPRSEDIVRAKGAEQWYSSYNNEILRNN